MFKPMTDHFILEFVFRTKLRLQYIKYVSYSHGCVQKSYLYYKWLTPWTEFCLIWKLQMWKFCLKHTRRRKEEIYFGLLRCCTYLSFTGEPCQQRIFHCLQDGQKSRVLNSIKVEYAFMHIKKSLNMVVHLWNDILFCLTVPTPAQAPPLPHTSSLCQTVLSETIYWTIKVWVASILGHSGKWKSERSHRKPHVLSDWFF